MEITNTPHKLILEYCLSDNIIIFPKLFTSFPCYCWNKTVNALLDFNAKTVLIPHSTELFWTLSAAGKTSRKCENNCFWKKVYEKKTPNWQSTDMHKKNFSVFKYSETFIKEKAVHGSKIPESNLMHKTYSTYGHWSKVCKAVSLPCMYDQSAISRETTGVWWESSLMPEMESTPK